MQGQEPGLWSVTMRRETAWKLLCHLMHEMIAFTEKHTVSSSPQCCPSQTSLWKPPSLPHGTSIKAQRAQTARPQSQHLGSHLSSVNNPVFYIPFADPEFDFPVCGVDMGRESGSNSHDAKRSWVLSMGSGRRMQEKMK